MSLPRTDIWTVGSSGATPFAEQYNGSTWTTVPMATPTGSTQTTFAGVTAISATDLWAVGNYLTAAGDYSTLAEHWNGTAWSIVASPNVKGATDNQLTSVSAPSATPARPAMDGLTSVLPSCAANRLAEAVNSSPLPRTRGLPP